MTEQAFPFYSDGYGSFTRSPTHPELSFRIPPGKELPISSIKEYLSVYQTLQEEIAFLEQRLVSLHQQRKFVSPLQTDEKTVCRAENVFDEKAALRELEGQYHRTLLAARVQSARIEHMISSLSTPQEKQVLRARYMEGLSWSEVADRFAISESLTYRIHKKAISALAARYGFETDEGPSF